MTETHLDPAIDVASFEEGGAYTCLAYQYRDADNFKQYEDVVLNGALTLDQALAVIAWSDELDGFVPSAVGLEDLQDRMVDGWRAETDHPFHEIARIALVDQAPTTTMTAEQFLARFLAADWAAESDRVTAVRGALDVHTPTASTDAGGSSTQPDVSGAHGGEEAFGLVGPEAGLA